MAVGITKDVIVKDKDSSLGYGTASMVNGKIQISALEKALAADKLSLKLVDGCLPEMDKDGWSVRALPEHTDVVVVTTAPKPGRKTATAYAAAPSKHGTSNMLARFVRF